MTRRRRPGNPKLAIAYLRVSTADQRIGPEAQRASIAAWAARERVEVVAWFSDDGVSGANEIADRPALLAALGALREHGAGVLVVAKRDRIARDAVVAGLIDRAVRATGAELVSAAGEGNGSSPADAFMRTILDGAAAYERSLIRERTRAALATKKRRGERVGVVAFGYRLGADGVHLERDDAEQVVIATVRELRAQGLTLRAIVAELATRGVRGRTGKALQLTQIANVLRSIERAAA